MPHLFKVATHKRSKLSNMSHHIDLFLFVFRVCSIRGCIFSKARFWCIDHGYFLSARVQSVYFWCVLRVCSITEVYFYLYIMFIRFEKMCFWNGAFLKCIFHIYQKSQYIWLGTRQQLDKLDLAALSLEFPTFVFSTSVRDLGVILDQELSFVEHIEGARWSSGIDAAIWDWRSRPRFKSRILPHRAATLDKSLTSHCL